jgi:hypothetical protein
MASSLPILLLLALMVTSVVVLYGAALLLGPSRAPLVAGPFLAADEPSEHALSRFHVR